MDKTLLKNALVVVFSIFILTLVGGGMGIMIGGALGAVFGLIVGICSGLMDFISFGASISPGTLDWERGFDTLFAVTVLGVMYSSFVGAGVGVALGLPGGFLLGLIVNTLQALSRLSLRKWVVWLAFGCGVAALLIAAPQRIPAGLEFWGGRELIVITFLFLLIPPLLAGVGAAFACDKIFAWYENQPDMAFRHREQNVDASLRV